MAPPATLPVSTHLVGSIGCLSSCAGCLSIQPLLRPSLPGARDVALPRGSSPAKAERRALRYRDNKDISPLGLLLQTEKQIWRACAQGLLVIINNEGALERYAMSALRLFHNIEG